MEFELVNRGFDRAVDLEVRELVEVEVRDADVLCFSGEERGFETAPCLRWKGG